MTGLATTRAIDRSGGHLYTYKEGSKSFGPYPGATAITALQDSLGGNDGLLHWAVNGTLDDLLARVARGQSLDEAAKAARNWRNNARDLGTAIHAVADQVNRGVAPQMFTEGVAPYAAQYGAALYQRGIKIFGSERYVVNTTIGVGGTLDSLVEIEGERGPLDVKSGKEKPSQRLQLTILSMGEWWGEAGIEAEPMPKLDGVGFILLLQPDGYRLVRHEITDEDREHVIHLVAAYHRIREWAASFTPTALKEAA